MTGTDIRAVVIWMSIELLVFVTLRGAWWLAEGRWPPILPSSGLSVIAIFMACAVWRRMFGATFPSVGN